MRKALIAAGGLALALTLSACGDKTIGGSPSTTFTDAPALAAAAKESASEKKTAKFTMDMNMGFMSMKGNGEARYDGANSEMSMTMDAMGQQMEMRLVDRTLYMKMPPGMPGADPAKPWAKMSLEELGGSGANLDQMLEQSDPTKMLEMFQETGTITNSEETTLDGQSAVHYTVEVDFEKVLEKLGAGAAMGADELKNSGIDKMPVDVWLSEDNLPLQIEIKLGEMMKKAAGKSAEGIPTSLNMDNAKMTMTYSDWGAPVNIEAPPADQVSEQAVPGLGGGN